MKKLTLIFSFLFFTKLHAQQLPGFSNKSNIVAVCEGLAFSSDEEAYKKVKLICEAIDIAGNFIVAECSNVDNCKAVLNSSGSYIFYNKLYIQKVKGLNFTEASFKTSNAEDWDVLCILAHEIGHHVLQHLNNFQQLSRMMPLTDMELEADRFAGSCLFKLGATLPQAQHVMHDISVSEKATMNHPGRNERLEAIAIGYNKAKSKNGAQNANDASEKIAEAISNWTKGNYDVAVREFKKHADHPRVWFYLGYAFYSGTGTEKDTAQAINYFRKSAEAGNAASQCELAEMYYLGEDITQNFDKAFKYMSMAADQNEPRAMVALAFMYYRGEGCTQSNEKFLEIMTSASKLDIPIALHYMGELYRDGEILTVDLTKSFEYEKRAAIFDLDDAQYTLAEMYEKGSGTEKNLKYAMHWYRKAAKQDHTQAKEACKRLNISLK